MRKLATILVLLLAATGFAGPVFKMLLATPAPSGGGGPTVIIQDDFTGAAGTLHGTTPDTINLPGNTWSVENGTWTLSGSGSVVATGGSAPYNIALIESGVSNVTVGTTVVFGGTASSFGAGAIGRATDENNFIRAIATRNDPELQIVIRSGGTETTVASEGSVAVGSGHTVSVWLAMSGDNLTATMTNLTSGLGTTVSYTTNFNGTATGLGDYSRGGSISTGTLDFQAVTP